MIDYRKYMKGILIENSFEPEVGEMNELFEVEHEKVFVWTHEKDRNSSIIIKVDPEVKDMPYLGLLLHVPIFPVLPLNGHDMDNYSTHKSSKYNVV